MTVDLGPHLDANLARVMARVRATGRDPATVRIIAVTKGFGPDVVRAAASLGLLDIGENYADELVAKAAGLTGLGIRWHFQGAIQTNKINRLSAHVSCWQSVDSASHMAAIAKRVPGATVLVQVDQSGQAQRSGCRPDRVAEVVAAGRSVGLDVAGLMCVASLGGDPAAEFGVVAELADTLELRERSMGMSDDFEVALVRGATMIRLGSVLFGTRPRRAAPMGSTIA